MQSRGLGAASALALAAEGADVSVVSRSGAAPDPSLRALRFDLSCGDGVEGLLSHVRDSGPFDILIGNTGGPSPGPVQGIEAGEWVAAFQAMAVSLFRVADAVLPGMLEARWGRIITVGSSSIEQPIPGLVLSNAIRASVAGWSKTLAAEVAPHGITVNMVLPGRIDTDRVRDLDRMQARVANVSEEEAQAQAARDIPIGRYGRPEEFGGVVAFLASRQASYVTGSMLRVDGGLTRSL